MPIIKRNGDSDIGTQSEPFKNIYTEKIFANNLPKKVVVSGDATGEFEFNDDGVVTIDLAIEQSTGISFKGVLNGEDLNNVLEDGYYIQRLNDGAQPELNYPIVMSGMLFVMSYKNSSEVIEFTFQQYQSSNGTIFSRSYNHVDNIFSPWTSNGVQTFTDNIPVGTIARFPADEVDNLPDDWKVIDETYDYEKIILGDDYTLKQWIEDTNGQINQFSGDIHYLKLDNEVNLLEGSGALKLKEVLEKLMPIINAISFFDTDVSSSYEELSKYYSSISLANELNDDEKVIDGEVVSPALPEFLTSDEKEKNNEETK